MGRRNLKVLATTFKNGNELKRKIDSVQSTTELLKKTSELGFVPFIWICSFPPLKSQECFFDPASQTSQYLPEARGRPGAEMLKRCQVLCRMKGTVAKSESSSTI